MEDEELLRRFEDCTLPWEAWTHRCHVKVALLYLRQSCYDEALVRIRAGIKKYNAANNVPDTPTVGYHETTTQAFLRLVATTLAAYSDAVPFENADGFCDAHPQLMTSRALRFFYSPERRMHPLAKTQFVEPDLAPLPMPRPRTK